MNKESGSQMNEEFESEEEKRERARRMLSDVPEGIEISDMQLMAWAKEYNQSLCYPQASEQHRDGWYMHMPDGTSEKVAESGEDRPTQYLIYDPSGRIGHSKTVPPYAIEVKRTRPLRKTETSE